MVIVESQRALEKKIDTLLNNSESTQSRMAKLEMQFYTFVINSQSPSAQSLIVDPENRPGPDRMSIRQRASAEKLADAVNAPVLIEAVPPSASAASLGTASRMESISGALEHGNSSSSSLIPRIEFEEALQESGVYRRVHRSSDAFSMVTNDRQSIAGSVITTFSLADDSSILTAFPIIDRSDLRNPECYGASAKDLSLLKELRGSVKAQSLRGVKPKSPGATFSLGSFRYPLQLGQDVIGDWSLARRRVFLRSELRLDVYFQVPVFFVCPLNNTRGPIANQRIYHLQGTEESKLNAWIGDDRIASSGAQSIMSWLFLLSTIHKMERTSIQWQQHMIPRLYERDRNIYDKENLPSNNMHTITVAIQRKEKSWDNLPSNFRQPYAITTLCHLIEIAAMLGIYWKEFQRSHDIYRAEGNGILLTGQRIDNLGLMFNFQAIGRSIFERDRLVPIDDIKDLCFGYVGTIFRDKEDFIRHPMVQRGVKDLQILSLATPKEMAETAMAAGCNLTTVNYFLKPSSRTSHIFPSKANNPAKLPLAIPSNSNYTAVSFEIIGMVGQLFHVKHSLFRRLPNPTRHSWDTRFFSTSKFLSSFERLLREGSSPQQEHISFLLRQTEKVMSEVGPEAERDFLYILSEENQSLLIALHEVVEELDKFLVRDAKKTKIRLIKKILAHHIQEVLYQMNEPLLFGEGLPRHTRFAKIDSAPLEERENQIMEVYFNEILPAVMRQVDPADIAAKWGNEDLMSIKSRRSRSLTSLDSDNGDSEAAMAHATEDMMPDANVKDVWCALVLRMICWLMLHDFDRLDVQVPKSELFGSRMPVYIS